MHTPTLPTVPLQDRLRLLQPVLLSVALVAAGLEVPHPVVAGVLVVGVFLLVQASGGQTWTNDALREKISDGDCIF